MSRVGKQPVTIPQGVDVKVADGSVTVKGPKGQLVQAIHPMTSVAVENGSVTVTPANTLKVNRKFHGLTRALINNMVLGVTNGFSKSLTLVGVGYRAAQKGKDITFTLGYSHPIEFKCPEGIELKVVKPTEVTVTGIDKALVGQTAAVIRGFRKPEPYHGKGVRYTDERISTKVGKAAGKK